MNWVPPQLHEEVVVVGSVSGRWEQASDDGALSSLRWKCWSVRTNDCELLRHGSAESILSKAKQERKRTFLTCSYFKGGWRIENILREFWQVKNTQARDWACSVPQSLLIPESPAT
jgi:hypothetical protein